MGSCAQEGISSSTGDVESASSFASIQACESEAHFGPEETIEQQPEESYVARTPARRTIVDGSVRLETPSTAILQFDGETATMTYPQLGSNVYYQNEALSIYPMKISNNIVTGIGVFDTSYGHGVFYIYDYKLEKYMSSVSGYFLPDNRFAMSSMQQSETDNEQLMPLLFDSHPNNSYGYTIYNENFTEANVQVKFDFEYDTANGSKLLVYAPCGFGYSLATDEYFMLYVQQHTMPGQVGFQEEDMCMRIAWFNSSGKQTGDVLSVDREFNRGKMGQTFYYAQPVIPLDESHFLLQPFANDKVAILDTIAKTCEIFDNPSSIDDDDNRDEPLRNAITPYGLERTEYTSYAKRNKMDMAYMPVNNTPLCQQ